MCNAYNHSPECDCGWGGQGWPDGDRRGIRLAPPPPRPEKECPNYVTLAEYYPYVCYNARCPVCHANVFFYQSPYGGRVFFDELGPPWPKHPCTDWGTRITVQDPGHGQKCWALSWRRQGWIPFICEKIAEEADGVIVSGHWRSQLSGREYKVRVALAGDYDSLRVWLRTPPAQPYYLRVKPGDPWSVEVSTFLLDRGCDPIPLNCPGSTKPGWGRLLVRYGDEASWP